MREKVNGFVGVMAVAILCMVSGLCMVWGIAPVVLAVYVMKCFRHRKKYQLLGIHGMMER